MVEPAPLQCWIASAGEMALWVGCSAGILRGGGSRREWIQFAWATGAMVTTLLTD